MAIDPNYVEVLLCKYVNITATLHFLCWLQTISYMVDLTSVCVTLYVISGVCSSDSLSVTAEGVSCKVNFVLSI
jgi:hypothetical protein